MVGAACQKAGDEDEDEDMESLLAGGSQRDVGDGELVPELLSGEQSQLSVKLSGSFRWGLTGAAPVNGAKAARMQIIFWRSMVMVVGDSEMFVRRMYSCCSKSDLLASDG